MSESDDPDSKTEEATEKRIADALQKGQTASSREVVVLATLTALAVWVSAFAFDAAARLVPVLSLFFEHAGTRSLASPADLRTLFETLLGHAGEALLAFFVLVILGALAAALVQNEPRLVADRIAPKLSHLSLAKGWKRVFGKAGMVEFAKAFAKLSIALIIAFAVLRGSGEKIVSLMDRAPVLLSTMISGEVRTLLIAICGAMIAIAMVDYLWTRHRWRTGLRMTRKDVADEMKQAEGDPILKARLRSLAQDRSRHRMFDDVATATMIVANPVHVAVALRYRHGKDPAPVVVARGAELLCMRIRELAEENDVPIFEEKPLARAIYAVAKVGEPIPAEFYAAIAALINIIAETEAKTARLRGRRP